MNYYVIFPNNKRFFAMFGAWHYQVTFCNVYLTSHHDVACYMFIVPSLASPGAEFLIAVAAIYFLWVRRIVYYTNVWLLVKLSKLNLKGFPVFLFRWHFATTTILYYTVPYTLCSRSCLLRRFSTKHPLSLFLGLRREKIYDNILSCQFFTTIRFIDWFRKWSRQKRPTSPAAPTPRMWRMWRRGWCSRRPRPWWRRTARRTWSTSTPASSPSTYPVCRPSAWQSRPGCASARSAIRLEIFCCWNLSKNVSIYKTSIKFSLFLIIVISRFILYLHSFLWKPTLYMMMGLFLATKRRPFIIVVVAALCAKIPFNHIIWGI